MVLVLFLFKVCFTLGFNERTNPIKRVVTVSKQYSKECMCLFMNDWMILQFQIVAVMKRHLNFSTLDLLQERGLHTVGIK